MSEPLNKYRKPNKCPYCFTFLDAATSTEDEMLAPCPGDLSFCIVCAEACQFNDKMGLIKFDLDSIKDHYSRGKLKKMQQLMRELLKIHPRQ